MTKYLIFNNSPSSDKSNVPGSPEDIACDIARVIENEGNSKKRFISYPAKSTDATFASLQEAPRYAVELNQKKNIAIVIVEHSIKTVLNASHKSFVLSGGKIVYDGDSTPLLIGDTLKNIFLKV
jgi:ABC-type lipopolysaccharide export system ATPase subunit